MPAAQRPMTAFALRPRLSAMAAMGALGLGLLIAPAGIATADPAKSTTTSTSTRQAPDSLFPEQGSSRYDVKHYAISLTYQSSGEIKAKTTLVAKTKKRLKSFSLDLEGLTVDSVKVNGHRADFSQARHQADHQAIQGLGRPLLGHRQVPREADHTHRPRWSKGRLDTYQRRRGGCAERTGRSHDLVPQQQHPTR